MPTPSTVSERPALLGGPKTFPKSFPMHPVVGPEEKADFAKGIRTVREFFE